MVTEAPTADLPAIPQPPPAPRRRHPVARGFGLVVGWLCAAGAGLGLAVHFLDTTHQVLVVLASGAWVFAPLSVVALGLHLWRRGWIAVLVTALLVAAQVVVYAPLVVGEAAPASPAARVEVLTQNMLYGTANAHALVRRIKSSDVEVFVAQELTPQAVTALRSVGLDKLLPYSVLDARPRSAGTGLWSRYPISNQQTFAREELAGVMATLTLPEGTTFTALTLHPNAPFPQNPTAWYQDLARIRALLRTVPAGPVLAGGDFNATYDNARFRQILGDGWRDGAEQAGAGVIRSWPADKGIPPLVGIDHVLTRGTVATSVETVAAPGSDHRGLLATVVVPR